MKTTVRRRGDKEYRYLSLVEAVRVEGKNTHRTLLRLGEVSGLAASGKLDRIIDALSAHAQGTWLSASDLEAADAPALGAMAALHAYWCRLGLDAHFSALGEARGAEHLDDTVFAMVANRLLAPCSKRALPEWLDADVVVPEAMVPPSVDQCYRALDAVAEAQGGDEEPPLRHPRRPDQPGLAPGLL